MPDSQAARRLAVDRHMADTRNARIIIKHGVGMEPHQFAPVAAKPLVHRAEHAVHALVQQFAHMVIELVWRQRRVADGVADQGVASALHRLDIQPLHQKRNKGVPRRRHQHAVQVRPGAAEAPGARVRAEIQFAGNLHDARGRGRARARIAPSLAQNLTDNARRDARRTRHVNQPHFFYGTLLFHRRRFHGYTVSGISYPFR